MEGAAEMEIPEQWSKERVFCALEFAVTTALLNHHQLGIYLYHGDQYSQPMDLKKVREKD